MSSVISIVAEYEGYDYSNTFKGNMNILGLKVLYVIDFKQCVDESRSIFEIIKFNEIHIITF